MDNHHSVQTISGWCCGENDLSAEKQQQFFDKNIVTISEPRLKTFFGLPEGMPVAKAR